MYVWALKLYEKKRYIGRRKRETCATKHSSEIDFGDLSIFEENKLSLFYTT